MDSKMGALQEGYESHLSNVVYQQIKQTQTLLCSQLSLIPDKFIIFYLRFYINHINWQITYSIVIFRQHVYINMSMRWHWLSPLNCFQEFWKKNNQKHPNKYIMAIPVNWQHLTGI